MKKIIVNGGKALSGEVTVSGSKNAALPIIFACILTKGISEIEDLPRIGDVEVALDLLKDFGARITVDGRITYIDTTELSYIEPNAASVSKIRASTYLIGACLSRFGRCPLMSFGGCNFALRPIDMHIDACLALGARINGGEITADCLNGGRIDFHKASVGATVNAILLASCAKGETVISGAAKEPHIDALIGFLISCGADISLRGGSLHIIGGELHGGRTRVIGDMIEAGTYLAIGLLTGGDVKLTNCPIGDMKAIFDAFSLFGAKKDALEEKIKLSIKKIGKKISVNATPYPGFPTDLQPVFAPLMAANSGGRITDNVWKTRFGYLAALSNFGVKYSLSGNVAEIYPSNIKCGETTAPDLRGGVACLLAALSAEGRSIIYSADVILRGYEDLEKKLRALGADIVIENN